MIAVNNTEHLGGVKQEFFITRLKYSLQIKCRKDRHPLDTRASEV